MFSVQNLPSIAGICARYFLFCLLPTKPSVNLARRTQEYTKKADKVDNPKNVLYCDSQQRGVFTKSDKLDNSQNVLYCDSQQMGVCTKSDKLDNPQNEFHNNLQ